MNEIEKELKLSKKQNYNDRYNYLCSQFNGIEYAIKLEKYTNKLLKQNKKYKRMLNIKEELDKKGIAYEWDFKDMFDIREENTQLKQQLKDKDEKISKVKEYCIIEREDINGSKCDDILEILESNKED